MIKQSIRLWLLLSMLICLGREKAVAEDTYANISKSAMPVQTLNLGETDRRTGILDGNLIRSAFSNFGNLGSRTLDIRCEWPKGSGISYLFECCFYVAAEVIDADGQIIHIISDSYTGGLRDRPADDSHTYSWEPLPGFFNETGSNIFSYPAMSHLPDTWPALWPNRLQEWAGRWIGELGSFAVADQESYYLMDDRNNDEFAYYPFVGSQQDSLPWPDGKRGLGVEVQVRHYQWTDPRLQNAWIAIYDIKNISDKDLPRVVCGFYHDWDVGTEGSYSDADDDISIADVKTGLIYQWDANGRSPSGKPVGYITQKILATPDNLGLTSFAGTTAGDVLSDDEKAWQYKIQPGTFSVPTGELDVAFITGSGYFSLRCGETKRYAIAILLGQDLEELYGNSKFVKWFYDGRYSFDVHDVELLSPTGGETLSGPTEIKWLAAGMGDRLDVDIFYSTDDWTTWHFIADREKNDGQYLWDTNKVKDGINYSIRVVAYNSHGMGQSHGSDPVTINNPIAAFPQVFFNSPGADETAYGTFSIRWRAGDADGDVVTLNLYFSPDDGHSWFLISENEANDGIYAWDTTPLPNGTNYRLKAVASDGHLESETVAAHPFRISNDHPPFAETAIQHISGSGDGEVRVHVTNRAALTSHTYELTFYKSDAAKTFDVYDTERGTFVLRDSPLTAMLEGAEFDGVRLWIKDHEQAAPVDSLTRWITGNANLIPLVAQNPAENFVAMPADFEIRILGPNADTSYSAISAFRVPVNFQVWNVTDNVKMEFLFNEFDPADGKISSNDILQLITNRNGRRYDASWRITFSKSPFQDTILPALGDIFFITITKPFSEKDVFRFRTAPELIASMPASTQSAATFSLSQNYPNPFNAVTAIEYSLEKVSKVTMKILNMLGREVVTLVDAEQTPGVYRIQWNGCDKDHLPAASGIYLVRIETGEFSSTRKMIFLR